jgi:hypothetical protein
VGEYTFHDKLRLWPGKGKVLQGTITWWCRRNRRRKGSMTAHIGGRSKR